MAWIESVLSSGGSADATYYTVVVDDAQLEVVNDLDELVSAVRSGKILNARPDYSNFDEFYSLTEIYDDETNGIIRLSFMVSNFNGGGYYNGVGLSRINIELTYSDDTWTAVVDMGGTNLLERTGVYTQTLTAGSTSVSFNIPVDTFSTSDIEFLTSVAGINPTAVSTSTSGSVTTLTLTFEAQQADVSVKVRCTR